MLSTREDLLGSFQRRYHTLTLPSGRMVRIQNLNELERCRIEAKRLNAKTDADRRQALLEDPCRWVVACVVDAAGERLFKNEDVPDLMQLDSADTRAIYVAAQEHCGAGAALSVEDHEKNCGAMNGDSSPGD